MNSLTLSHKEFKRIVSQCKDFTSYGGRFSKIQFVYVHQTDDGLVAVATDMYKLIVLPIEGELTCEDTDLGVLIPIQVKGINGRYKIATSVLKGKYESIEIQTDEKSTTLFADGKAIHTEEVCGLFPPYQKVIPSVSECTPVDLDEFITCDNGKDCRMREYGYSDVRKHLKDSTIRIDSKDILRIDGNDGSIKVFVAKTVYPEVFPVTYGPHPLEEPVEKSPFDQWIDQNKVKGVKGTYEIAMSNGSTGTKSGTVFGSVWGFSDGSLTHIPSGLGVTCKNITTARRVIALINPLADWDIVTDESFSDLENVRLIQDIMMTGKFKMPELSDLSYENQERLTEIMKSSLAAV